VFKNKYEAMYVDIHNYRSRWTKYYLTVSLTRRVCFVLIPVLFYADAFIQVQLLQALSISYVIWYGSVRPHIFNRRVQLEMFNEAVIMGFNYHMIIFSDFCFEPSFQFSMGYAYAALLAICVAVNMAHMIVRNAEVARRKRKLAGLKAGYVARLDDFNRRKAAQREAKKEAWKKRQKLRAFLNDAMTVPEEPEPILMPFKIKKALEEARERKKRILDERKKRKESLDVLRSMTRRQRQ